MKNILTIVDETKSSTRKETAAHIFAELDKIWILRYSRAYKRLKDRYLIK